MRIFNRKARFKYTITEKQEAGIMLTGAEIKSLRSGRASLSESFAKITNGEVYLKNAYITPWVGTEKLINPRRDRKLLLHKKQILNLQGKTSGGAMVLFPMAIYIKKNLAKVELALGKSKAKYDKRAKLKKETVDRDVNRAIRGEKD
jgi:SsrA-binding protein